MTNPSTNHYTTLGVPETANATTIKQAFRALSLKYHPDLQKATSCSEHFKRISNAHSILSNPLQKQLYDRQRVEERMWKQGMDNSNMRRPGGRRPRRPTPQTGHVVMETLTNPRYFLWGMVGLGGVTIVGSVFGTLTSKRPDFHLQTGNNTFVEAWLNPKTGRYEQPAPWDPDYQRLQPDLIKVPREKVAKRQL